MYIGLVGMPKHKNENLLTRDLKMEGNKHDFCRIHYMLKQNPNQH